MSSDATHLWRCTDIPSDLRKHKGENKMLSANKQESENQADLHLSSMQVSCHLLLIRNKP